MKLMKCSLLLMASVAALFASNFANAACPYPPKMVMPTSIVAGCPAAPATPPAAGYQYVYDGIGKWLSVAIPKPITPAPTQTATQATTRCAYPKGAMLPPPTTTISPACPARPAVAAPAGYTYVYDGLSKWITVLTSTVQVNTSTPAPTGVVTATSYPSAKPPVKTALKKAKSSAVGDATDNTSALCLQPDGTWYTLDGNMAGSWSMIGSEISLSGNNEFVGGSAVLSVLEPGVSMVGSIQQWQITDPNAEQAVYNTIWTVNSPSCGE